MQRVYIGRLIEKHGDDYQVCEVLFVDVCLGSLFYFAMHAVFLTVWLWFSGNVHGYKAEHDAAFSSNLEEIVQKVSHA